MLRKRRVVKGSQPQNAEVDEEEGKKLKLVNHAESSFRIHQTESDFKKN